MEENVFKFGVLGRENTPCDDAEFLTAIVSIEVQKFGEVYDTEKGFKCGTIFPVLNKPFLAGGMC